MSDLVDLTAAPGEVGWHVVDQDLSPHRCSRKHCHEPGVIFYLCRTYHRKRRWTRRWASAYHMNQYDGATPWHIDGDRILREPYPYEVDRAKQL